LHLDQLSGEGIVPEQICSLGPVAALISPSPQVRCVQPPNAVGGLRCGTPFSPSSSFSWPSPP
jgi:hypothetical protein